MSQRVIEKEWVSVHLLHYKQDVTKSIFKQ